MSLEARYELALQIVKRLTSAGHTAYWVGGCVRDRLLGLKPKDYDVATSARPEQVLELFEHAELIGASFGVVLVQGEVEVATFRSEGAYRDGRHPEQVQYETEASLDAMRRDFTINGLFFDPLRNEVLDFVGGQADLNAGLIRAIGIARDRFADDHLRLLRAVRFAARFDYEIESETMAALIEMAPLLLRVARERLHDEMRRLILGPNLRVAWRLLKATGLFQQMVPEAKSGERVGRLEGPVSVALGWAAMLEGVKDLQKVFRDLRFSREEMDQCGDLLRCEELFEHIAGLGTAELKRFLRKGNVADHLELHRASFGETAAYVFVRQRLEDWSVQDLWPQHFLTGEDLIELGLTPGPLFSKILRRIEDAQLENSGLTREDVVRLALSEGGGHIHRKS